MADFIIYILSCLNTYLGESLSTSFIFALIWFSFIMDTLMLLHGRVLSECTLTYRTKFGIIKLRIYLPNVWALTSVGPLMLF